MRNRFVVNKPNGVYVARIHAGPYSPAECDVAAVCDGIGEHVAVVPLEHAKAVKELLESLWFPEKAHGSH